MYTTNEQVLHLEANFVVGGVFFFFKPSPPLSFMKHQLPRTLTESHAVELLLWIIKSFLLCKMEKLLMALKVLRLDV